MEYLILKWIHILSAILMFGTGLGSAFYKLFTDRSGNIEAIVVVNKLVVRADWIFTTPTAFIQPLSGLAMVYLVGYPLDQLWLSAGFGLYALAGLCWVPVVVLQIQMRSIAEQSLRTNEPLPAAYFRTLKIWIALGVPAFLAMIAVTALMVLKPA